MASCSNPVSNNNDVGGSGEVPSEPFTMACVAFTSGLAAVFGTPMMQAAQMIVDRINENGGILGE